MADEDERAMIGVALWQGVMHCARVVTVIVLVIGVLLLLYHAYLA